MGNGGDDEGQGKPHGDGGQMGAHYQGTHYRRQHVGDLRGEGCLRVGPREMERTQSGVLFALGWYQKDFPGSGLEKLKGLQDLC